MAQSNPFPSHCSQIPSPKPQLGAGARPVINHSPFRAGKTRKEREKAAGQSFPLFSWVILRYFFLSFDFFQPPKPRSCPKDARVSDTAGFLLKVMGETGFPVRPVQTGVGKQRGAPAQPAAEGAGQGAGSRSSKPSQRSPEAAPCSGASHGGGLRNSQGCQKKK